MSPTVQSQLAQLTEIQRAVRDWLQEGGSPIAVLAVLACIAAVLFATYYLTRRQRRRDQGAVFADPRQLLHTLLSKLPLTPSQRYSLTRVANELDLKQPAALILSPVLFDRYFDQWRTGHGSTSGRGADESVAKLAADARQVLFPTS